MPRTAYEKLLLGTLGLALSLEIASAQAQPMAQGEQMSVIPLGQAIKECQQRASMEGNILREMEEDKELQDAYGVPALPTSEPFKEEDLKPRLKDYLSAEWKAKRIHDDRQPRAETLERRLKDAGKDDPIFKALAKSREEVQLALDNLHKADSALDEAVNYCMPYYPNPDDPQTAARANDSLTALEKSMELFLPKQPDAELLIRFDEKQFGERIKALTNATSDLQWIHEKAAIAMPKPTFQQRSEMTRGSLGDATKKMGRVFQPKE